MTQSASVPLRVVAPKGMGGWALVQLRSTILTVMDGLLIVVVTAILAGVAALVVRPGQTLEIDTLLYGGGVESKLLWSAILLACFLVYRLSHEYVHNPLWPPKSGTIPLTTMCHANALTLFSRIKSPITPLMLLKELCTVPAVVLVLVRSELPLKLFAGLLAERIQVSPTTSDTAQSWATGLVEEIILRAATHASQSHGDKITVLDILSGALQDPEVIPLFQSFPGRLESLSQSIDRVDRIEELRRRMRHFGGSAHASPKGPMNVTMTAVATPMLDAVSIDCTDRVKHSPYIPYVGREEEFAQLFERLEGHQRRVVVVGFQGVGKSSLIQELAQRMVEGRVPAIINDHRLLSIDPSRLIAGANQPGEVEYRVQRLLAEISCSRNIVLVFEQVEQFIGLSSTGHTLDVLDELTRILEQSSLVVIATTTEDQFRANLETKTNFTSVFHRFDLNEMSEEGALRVLEAHAAVSEGRDQVLITTPALRESIRGSLKAIHDQFLPEKAVRVLDQAVSLVGSTRICTSTVVDEALSGMTHVPFGSVGGPERELLLHLETVLAKTVVGQGYAITSIANALRRARSELANRQRPIANFLFVGPTGVGKTHLAETVAAAVLGSSMRLVRLDMSEYQEASSVDRFLGVPGSGHGGVVTEALRANPYALVLLDELEKAHPKVLTLLLQLMDEGRLTDVTGRTIDATNMLVTATSNAATPFITSAFQEGKTADEVHRQLLDTELAAIFPPELINRFDDIIVFEPLTADQIRQIAQLELSKLTSSLKLKGIILEFPSETIEWIGTLGFDPKYGARPLRRAISDHIENVLSAAMLEGKVNPGDHMRFLPNGQLTTVT